LYGIVEDDSINYEASTLRTLSSEYSRRILHNPEHTIILKCPQKERITGCHDTKM
jgi:hypothetical protein